MTAPAATLNAAIEAAAARLAAVKRGLNRARSFSSRLAELVDLDAEGAAIVTAQGEALIASFAALEALAPIEDLLVELEFAANSKAELAREWAKGIKAKGVKP